MGERVVSFHFWSGSRWICMGGTIQATAGFQGSDFFLKAIKMFLRCILSVISHLSNFILLPGLTHEYVWVLLWSFTVSGFVPPPPPFFFLNHLSQKQPIDHALHCRRPSQTTMQLSVDFFLSLLMQVWMGTTHLMMTRRSSDWSPRS